MSHSSLVSESARGPMPGDMIAGKYRIERVLGEGGMGVVVLARHLALDENVAIKVLKPEAMQDREAVGRLEREARAMVRIKNEHVARVLDVGALDNGAPFIVMEHLVGHDLDTVLRAHQQFRVIVAVDYVAQACEALAAAHAIGIVHRDVKPSNLFLTSRADGTECLKVLDFGISKATSPMDMTRPDANLTRTQSVMGTPQYMAPEQMRRSRETDARTDVWGLGTLLYELLAGAPPFVASTIPELCAMILRDPFPPLRSKRPDVPPGLEAVVHRCLEKSPDMRFATATELAYALAPFGSVVAVDSARRIERANAIISGRMSPQTPQSVPMLTASSTAAVADTTTMQMPPPSMPEQRRKKPTALIVAAVAFVFVLGGGVAGILAMTRGRGNANANANAKPATEVSAQPPPPETPAVSGTVIAEAPATGTPPEASAEPSAKPHASAHHTTPGRPPASASAHAAPPASNPPGLATSRYD